MSFDQAGQWGPHPVLNAEGKALPAATFEVFEEDGTTPAVLYTDESKGTVQSQPVNVDGLGNATFFAEPGRYVIKFTIGGSSTSFDVPAWVDPTDVISRPEANAAFPRSGPDVVVREAPLPLSKYAGADPTGASDSAAAVNAWIADLRTAGSRAEGIAPDGHYRCDSPIEIKNTTGAKAPFPLITGASRDGTIFSGNHDSGDVFHINGTGHTRFQFFKGGGFQRLTITQEAGRTDLNGIRHNGWWDADLNAVLITDMSGDGIALTNLIGQTDEQGNTYTPADSFSSCWWDAVHLSVRHCGGWGLTNNGGAAGWSGMTMRACELVDCEKGAALIGGHLWHWYGGIASQSGAGSNGGGVTIAYQAEAGGHPRDLIIEGVEFDGNYGWHLLVEALTGGSVSDCGFIHHPNLHGFTDNAPLYGVILGDTGNPRTLSDLSFKRNFHRASTDGQVIAYDFRVPLAGINSEFNNYFHGSNPPDLIKYQGYDSVTEMKRPKISDAGKTLLPGSPPRAYISRIAAAQDVESTTNQIVFESEDSNQHGDGDTALGYLTPWVGAYQIEAWVTIENLSAGDRVILSVVYNGTTTVKEVSYFAGGGAVETFSINLAARIGKDNRITIHGRQTSGSAKAIRAGSPYNGFSVVPLVA